MKVLPTNNINEFFPIFTFPALLNRRFEFCSSSIEMSFYDDTENVLLTNVNSKVSLLGIKKQLEIMVRRFNNIEADHFLIKESVDTYGYMLPRNMNKYEELFIFLVLC